MAHLSELNPLMEQLARWAELRSEQGARIERDLDRFKRALVEALRRLERANPPATLRAREPDTLEQVRKLRPPGPRRLGFPADYDLRLRGAFLGRAAGCTLGVPVESWTPEHMQLLAMAGGQSFPPEDYWAVHPKADERHHRTNRYRDYLRGRIREVPVDDDIAYTLLGLLILERYGFDFTTEDVARAWLKHLPLAWTAEEVALKNLKAGVSPRAAAEPGNPYQEWIGADIRSDPWGYAAAGWPERAAEFAWRDASLSHRSTGVYGAMFFAACIAAAFVVSHPLDAVRIGLTEIPRDCRLARAIRWALRIAPRLNDWREARAAIERRFPGMHHVHTINNACLTVFGLHLGRGDFTRTIGHTVAMGYDNDCTAATAGSILGAVLGIDRVPELWWRPFRGRVRSYLRGHQYFTVSEILRRFRVLTIRLYEDHRAHHLPLHPPRSIRQLSLHKRKLLR